jgi:hypothetical protein
MNVERKAPKKGPRFVRIARIAATTRGRQLLRDAEARKEFERKVGRAVMDRMGGGMPSVAKIRDLPKTREEFERMRREMAEHHKTIAAAYTFLTHGEPLHNLSERFITNMGITPDQINRSGGYTPPENIRHRRLRPEVMAAEVDALRKRIEADELIDSELRENILGNLRIMKQKGIVGDHWGNIQIVAGNTRQILEGLTDPEVTVTAEEAREYLPGVRESLAVYDKLAGELPNRGKFTPEEVAHMYATFHGESRGNVTQQLVAKGRK